MGDTVVIHFVGLNGEGTNQPNKDDRKDTNPKNNSDIFIFKNATVSCAIKGDNEVCIGKEIELKGEPNSNNIQFWAISEADKEFTELIITDEVDAKIKGLKVGSVTVSYTNNGCLGIATHKIDVKDCPNAGIEEFSNNTISAYPNPAKDILNVQSYSTIESVSILSLDGKVLSTTYGGKVDISNLNSGVYLYRVISQKGETAVSKFVKE